LHAIRQGNWLEKKLPGVAELLDDADKKED
jgi:hypothetical protein